MIWHDLHNKHPIKEVVAENTNMAEIAFIVVSKMLDKSRMVVPLVPTMIP